MVNSVDGKSWLRKKLTTKFLYQVKVLEKVKLLKKTGDTQRFGVAPPSTAS